MSGVTCVSGGRLDLPTALSSLTLDKVGYTFANLSWTNVARTEARFLVTRGTVGSSTDTREVTVASGAKGQVSISGIEHSSTAEYYLYRDESGGWVPQTASSTLDHVIVSTHTPSASVSVGGEIVLVRWSRAYTEAEYAVRVYNSTASFSFSETDFGTDPSNASSVTLLLDDLELGTDYSLDIMAVEISAGLVPTESNLVTKTFRTTKGPVLEVAGVFASYVNVEWVGEDGVQYRLVDQSSGETLLTESGVISNLLPGTDMNVELERQQPDGSWVDQGAATFVTPSSTLSVSGMGSSGVALSWNALYEGATYSLTYTRQGKTITAAIPAGSTSVVFGDLGPTTSYVINLYVEENGQLVGLSSLGAGEPGGAGGVKTHASYQQLLAAVVVLVLVTILLKLRVK